MPKTIGFIGLGIMGKPMAKHLISAGYPLVVYNRTASKAQELVAMGARQVNSPKEVAEISEIIITMVADSPEVELVILGPAGVIEGAKPGSVVVDMSSISPIVTQRIAAALASKNVAMLDAPVSGGEVGAIQATLSIMVGGDEAVFNEVKPVFGKNGQERRAGRRCRSRRLHEALQPDHRRCRAASHFGSSGAGPKGGR